MHHYMIMYIYAYPHYNSLHRGLEETMRTPISYSWAPYSRIWDPVILLCLKQWLWPRTGLCGGCGRCMVVHNLELHARNNDDIRCSYLGWSGSCHLFICLGLCMLINDNSAVSQARATSLSRETDFYHSLLYSWSCKFMGRGHRFKNDKIDFSP